jgi:hypothetical protein
MSKRPPAISVLTANRLKDGIVMFLGVDGTWVESIDGAAVARTPEEAQALQARGASDAAANLVVEPYLAEVQETGGRRVPVRARERVRIAGPSILGDVPGYVAPAPRVPSPSPRSPSDHPREHAAPKAPEGERGEGRGEGHPHTPMLAPAAHHPSPLPALTDRVEGSALRGERESAEAA